MGVNLSFSLLCVLLIEIQKWGEVSAQWDRQGKRYWETGICQLI